MQRLSNQMRRIAQEVSETYAVARHGTVTSYDPTAYAVKVRIEPEGVLTGWIPLKSAWVGNGWGLFCPPSIGDSVELEFQEDQKDLPSAGWRFYNRDDRPLPCPSGEFWIVHKSGSLLKFHNDGTVELTTHDTLYMTVGNELHVNSSGPIYTSAPSLNHIGTLNVSGSVNVSGGDVIADGISLKTHRTTGVKAGGDISSVPTP